MGGTHGTGWRRAVNAVLILAAAAWTASAAQAQDNFTESLELVPIDCRWRANASAVRVGQPFSVVLTCSVIETASTIVAPDQSRLDPAVIDLQPFEVVGGQVGQEVRTPGYRHFQYEYDVRYFGELFGDDIPVPELTIDYRVQSRLESGETIEGRELQYALPPLAVRILSLVPGSTTDIRELPPATFAATDARRFRANAFDIAGLALLILGALAIVWVFAGLTRRRDTATAAVPRLVPDTTVLLAAANALAKVRRERHAGGWSSDLAARALTTLRIAGTVDTGGTLAQIEADSHGGPGDGRLSVRAVWPRRRSVWVSGSATPVTIEAEYLRRQARQLGGTARLEELQRLTATMTAATYARNPSAAPAAEALDDAVDGGERILRALAREHLRILRLARAAGESVIEVGRRAWAR